MISFFLRHQGLQAREWRKYCGRGLPENLADMMDARSVDSPILLMGELARLPGASHWPGDCPAWAVELTRSDEAMESRLRHLAQAPTPTAGPGGCRETRISCLTHASHRECLGWMRQEGEGAQRERTWWAGSWIRWRGSPFGALTRGRSSQRAVGEG